jgi:lantibiotic modifying enzyme
MHEDSLLEAARRIGQRLCADALFDRTGQLCNWMGRADILDRRIARYSVRSAAVGPELYGGSAGIALFLAELYGSTGDEATRLVARAAIRRSVHYMQQYPTGAQPVSFFAGHLGLAYATCRLMDLDPEADLDSHLAWLVDCIVPEETEPPPLDVIAGCAGAIPPLLVLARRPGLERLAPVAVRCGEEICRTAVWEDGLCHWDSARMIGGDLAAPPVTGFAHGPSGLALALLALYAETGTQRYRDTARGAFAFEDTFYSEADRNWVDTRHPYSQKDGRIEGTFQRAWCHGAPGIALARMHAAVLDPAMATEYRERAAAAIQTTVAAVGQRLQAPGADATLCHGLAGLSETMLRWGELWDPAYIEKASETALELVRRYDAAGDWPSGVNAGGPNPSLMIGTAGIGYHLLRVRSGGTIPSVLSLLV